MFAHGLNLAQRRKTSKNSLNRALVQFLKTSCASAFVPGNAGLQPGSRSHAGAWRSQDMHKHFCGDALGPSAVCGTRCVFTAHGT